MTDFCDYIWVDGCYRIPVSCFDLGNNLSPRINDQGMAIAFTVLAVLAVLCGGYDVGLVFDGAGFEQGVPMQCTRCRGERGWHAESNRALIDQLLIKARKANVVTYRDA